ncbi:MAG: diguanylate cyclase [Candidatus Xenobiia bacterium LiM19]
MKARVLVTDDDSTFRRMLKVALEAEDFQVIEAQDGQQCIEKTLKESPDIILLDKVMPQMDGIKTCNLLRSMNSTKLIPIIFLSVKGDVEHRIEGFSCGGDDYLPKPFDPSELCARILAILARTRVMRSRVENLETLYERVSQSNEELRKQTIFDELTHLYNYRYFLKRMEEELNRCIRYNRYFSLILFDLDSFANLNNTYGHSFGDRILKEIGFLLMNMLRGIDIVARFGGDEFIALLPETNLEGAQAVALRIQGKVTSLRVEENSTKLLEKLSVCTALATFPEHGSSIEEILKKTEKGVDRARKTGKNTIVVIEKE